MYKSKLNDLVYLECIEENSIVQKSFSINQKCPLTINANLTCKDFMMIMLVKPTFKH